MVWLLLMPALGSADRATSGPSLEALVQDALAHNPEIAAAWHEADAARQRVAPAGALDQPMLEFGIVNAPLGSLSPRREDMTMKMLGLGQRLPFPGKRALRRGVATADAESAEFAARETSNRVVRDLRVAYEDLVFNAEAQRIVVRTRGALEQLLAIAQSGYQVGRTLQNDVLDAQTELERLRSDLLRLAREHLTQQSELRRLLGRDTPELSITPAEPALAPEPAVGADPAGLTLANRPELLALRAVVDGSTRTVDLAQREYFPDFELKLQYGQRDRAPDGTPRDDMVSLTVGLNLPVWRKARLEPQVAEARALRAQAQSMLLARQLETQAQLETQLALMRQWRETAELYRSTLLPQARAAIASALAAYRVGRVDFLTLRQAQLRELEVATDLAEAIANHNKAVAEIDLLFGRAAP